MIKILWPLINGQIRHALSSVGGILVGTGYVTSTEWETLSGAILVLISIALSAFGKLQTAKVANTKILLAERNADLRVEQVKAHSASTRKK